MRSRRYVTESSSTARIQLASMVKPCLPPDYALPLPCPPRWLPDSGTAENMAFVTVLQNTMLKLSMHFERLLLILLKMRNQMIYSRLQASAVDFNNEIEKQRPASRQTVRWK
jgi:hypothetical protein